MGSSETVRGLRAATIWTPIGGNPRWNQREQPRASCGNSSKEGDESRVPLRHRRARRGVRPLPRVRVPRRAQGARHGRDRHGGRPDRRGAQRDPHDRRFLQRVLRVHRTFPRL